MPIVFTPMVIKTYPDGCTDKPPPWLEKAHTNPNAPPMLKAFADALYSYHDGKTKYVKLLDGGLVDNFGLSGFTISRLSARDPHEPLSPEQAVRLRRSIVILVDSGRAPSGDWVQTVEGPTGTELIMAAADTARAGERTRELHRLRAHHGAIGSASSSPGAAACRPSCASAMARRRTGIAATSSSSSTASASISSVRSAPRLLNAVDTRFKLPVDQVDAVIAAGRDALRVNPTSATSSRASAAPRCQPSRRSRRNRRRPRSRLLPDGASSSFAAAQ